MRTLAIERRCRPIIGIDISGESNNDDWVHYCAKGKWPETASMLDIGISDERALRTVDRPPDGAADPDLAALPGTD